jgi:hypothetical protein
MVWVLEPEPELVWALEPELELELAWVPIQSHLEWVLGRILYIKSNLNHPTQLKLRILPK